MTVFAVCGSCSGAKARGSFAQHKQGQESAHDSQSGTCRSGVKPTSWMAGSTRSRVLHQKASDTSFSCNCNQ